MLSMTSMTASYATDSDFKGKKKDFAGDQEVIYISLKYNQTCIKWTSSGNRLVPSPTTPVQKC